MNRRLVHHLLLRVLRNPNLMAGLTDHEWNVILIKGRDIGILGRIAFMAEEAGLLHKIPQRAKDNLTAAKIIALNCRTEISWEINRIQRALYGYKGKVVLLKGGAYIRSKHRAALGRRCSDVDILVAKSELDQVEEIFFTHGWVSQMENEYDQHYYRDLMHELPPLFNPKRGITIDIHHTILPPTGRLKPNPEKLLDQANLVVVTKDAGEVGEIHTLCDEDMVLHSAAHLFYDGELIGGIRNLLEQHDLISVFGSDGKKKFWDNIMPRAREMDLMRPFFYCLRYTEALLGTEIPREVKAEMSKEAPHALILKMMDFAVLQVLVPTEIGKKRLFGRFAAQGLYIRSHYLRMPFGMLMGHLAKKLFRRKDKK